MAIHLLRKHNAATGQHRNGSVRRVPVTVVVWFAMIATVCTVSDIVIPSPLGLGIAAVVSLVWYLWLMKYEAKTSLLGLNPVVVAQLGQALVLGIAPLYMALWYADDPYADLMGHWVSLDQVAYGHALMVVGSLAFYMGLKQFQPREAARSDVSAHGPSVWALAIAGIVGVAFQVGREVVTKYAGSAVAQLGMLPLAVLSMIALRPPERLRRSEKAHFGVLLLGTVVLLALNARRDSKLELMLSFVPLVWWSLARRKWALLVSEFLVLAALYLLVIAPVVMSLREASDLTPEDGASSVLNPVTFDTVLPALHGDFLLDSGAFTFGWLDETMNRVCSPVPAGWLASYADQRGFEYGSELTYALVALIPRVIWPNKPTVNQGAYFTVILGGAPSAEEAGTSTGLTSAGELYWNFGWPGVVIGMYVLGAVLAGVWWGAAGSDPRSGLLEMAAFLGSMLAFVAFIEAAAGSSFPQAITVGIFCRVLIAIRDRAIRRRTAWIDPRLAPTVRRGYC